MSVFAFIALLSWPLVSLLLFVLMPARRAMVYSFVLGFLFLPPGGIPLPGLPDYTKVSTVSISCLVMAAIFDPGPMLRIRGSWLDLFPALAIPAWSFSSLLNGHGVHDALSVTLGTMLEFGVPYLLGRAYLGSPEGLREIATGMLFGLAVYLPLIIFEFRFSAMLNYWIYGITSTAGHSGLLVRRPAVFFFHGLALSTWLGPLAALAVWLAVSRAWRGVWFLSAKSMAWIACAVTLLCFGRGSVALMALGAAAALGWRWFGMWRTPLLFAASVILYIVFAFADAGAPVRGWMVDLSGSVFGEGKGGSLQFRLDHEAILVWNTMRQSPLVGLGGWGANRDLGDLKAIEVLGHNEVVTDGLWVIIFSNRGLLGLISVWGWMLAPGIGAVLAIRRVPLSVQTQGVVLGLATWSFLYSFDCLLNAFWSSTQPLLAGAFATFVILCRRYRATPGRETDATARLQAPRRPRSHVALVKR